MTTETEKQQFRGVVCLHCKAAIPVPAIVGHTKVAPNEGGEVNQGNSQVFTLRCPVCHKEKPYWTREILDFEEIPGMDFSPVQPASVRPYPREGIGKAAKA